MYGRENRQVLGMCRYSVLCLPALVPIKDTKMKICLQRRHIIKLHVVRSFPALVKFEAKLKYWPSLKLQEHFSFAAFKWLNQIISGSFYK